MTFLLFSFLFLLCSGGITNISPLSLDPQHVLSQKQVVSVASDFKTPERATTIQVELDIRYAGANSASMQIVAAHSSALSSLRGCCTPEDVTDGNCVQDEVGLFLVDSDEFVLYWSSPVEDVLVVNYTMSLEKRGYWYLYIANCNEESLDFESGSLTWIDPFGYLLLQRIPYLTTYWVMGVVYFVSIVFWVVLYFLHRENIMGIQLLMATLLVYGFAEAIWYVLVLTDYNTSGVLNVGLLVVTIFLTAVKLSLVRLILLLVALGLYITKPSLGNFTKTAIGVMTVVYGACEGINDWAVLSSQYGTSVGLEFLIVLTDLLIVFVNIIFIGWIAWAAKTTLKLLTEKDEPKKASMYYYLGVFLIIMFVISSVVFIIGSLISVGRVGFDELFEIEWFFVIYWEFSYFIIIAYILWIWRPKKNNLRYAFLDRIEFGTDAKGSADTDSIELDYSEKQEKDIISSSSGLKVTGTEPDSHSSSSIDLSL